MECFVTHKNIGILCRICLTSSKNMVHLSDPIDEKMLNFKGQWPIHKMLEMVTFHKVVLDNNKFPSKICQMCLSFLKIGYEFQAQFKNSQKILEKLLEDEPIEKLNSIEELVLQEETMENMHGKISSPVAPVELIYGNNKFDLNDVLIIEDEKPDTFLFEGFLNNLGHEISARFVTNCDNQLVFNKNKIHIENSFTIKSLDVKKSSHISAERLEVKNFKEDFDIARLKVRKYPEDSRIIIEEVNDSILEPNRIIRTLYECRLCKIIVPSKDDLDFHIALRHEPPAHLICDKCGHIAHTQSALYHHLQKHKGRRFACDQCDKRFVTTSRLKIHLESHKNERRYLCNVCGKNFNYSISLSYHLRLHSDEKKYVCNFCGLKYRMSNTLERHLRTHTKDKPYQCEYCGKRFSSGGEKRIHHMLHTGERPFVCEYCGKGFIKRVTLHNHYLSHPGPHECHICEKTFLDTKFLKAHLKRIHSEFEVKEDLEN